MAPVVQHLWSKSLELVQTIELTKKKKKEGKKKNKIGEQLTFGFYAKSLNSLFRATLGANLDVHVYFS
jgi:hypothetical protein